MERQEKINKIIHNSKLLCKALNINPKDLSDIQTKLYELKQYEANVFSTPKYDVQIQNRCFKPWTYVLEITPTGTSSFNGQNCPWVEEAEGTCTLNLAPDNILLEVIASIPAISVVLVVKQKGLLDTIIDWFKERYS